MGWLLQVLTLGCAGVCAWAVACVLVARAHRLQRRENNVSFEQVVHDPVLSFATLACISLVVSAAVSLWALPLCLASSFVLAKRAPAILARRKHQELRAACESELDTLADIVAMGVRSGLSFDAALDLYCEKFTGHLANEMRGARVQWASGVASRDRALRDLAEQVGSSSLKRFVETTVQAIRYGSPLAEMLSQLGRNLRAEKAAAIEQQVEKAPVKMLIPTGMFILPATLILVVGPAVLQFLGSEI